MELLLIYTFKRKSHSQKTWNQCPDRSRNRETIYQCPEQACVKSRPFKNNRRDFIGNRLSGYRPVITTFVNKWQIDQARVIDRLNIYLAECKTFIDSRLNYSSSRADEINMAVSA